MKFFPLSRAASRVLLLAALSCHVHALMAADCDKPDRLRFSIFRNDVKSEMDKLQPLLDKLQVSLAIPVEVYTPPSYGAVMEALLTGAVQVARLGPASYVFGKRADPQLTAFASYENRANPFQSAGPFYHSLLIIKANSGITDIEALRGKRLALVDPVSTSGSLIPKQVFAKQIGKKLESYFAQVGYSGSHTQSVNRLLAGQIDAAFVGSQNLATALSADPDKIHQIRVIWRSGPIPTDPFVFRGQLCDGIKDKIRAVFFNHGGSQDTALLDKLKVLRFVPVSDHDYQIVRDMY